MSEKAIAALLEQPDPLTKKGLRDRFILLLMYDAAARLHELADAPLFYTARDGAKLPLDDGTVRKLIVAYGVEARKSCGEVPEHVHPHMIRHSRAMHLYQHGMDLTLLSQWLGHAHLETALIYAHADTEHKRRAIALATPANNPLRAKLNPERYTVTDDETLKKLYGLK